MLPEVVGLTLQCSIKIGGAPADVEFARSPLSVAHAFELVAAGADLAVPVPLYLCPGSAPVPADPTGWRT
jgi:hypothetical protein